MGRSSHDASSLLGVYSTVEVDMTNVVSFVQNFKESFFNSDKNFVPLFFPDLIKFV